MDSGTHILNVPGSPGALARIRAEVRGLVQGVGFRPFIYRLATDLGLTGWVGNSGQGAVVEVEGSPESLAAFFDRLDLEKPDVCVIREIRQQVLAARGSTLFEVCDSDALGPKTAGILPDLATCFACRQEIFDPANRRFRYPFTNCTHCGPRFSILEALPYDRARTTMKKFRMCRRCREEYTDPANRRFHAQPNACPACGPHLEFWDSRGGVLARREDALVAAAAAIRRCEIVAVKGLGGFHLMVDARDDEAVARLRLRKCREEKPFGLMFADVESIRAHCEIPPLEEKLLASPEAPLVLLRRLRPENVRSRPLAAGVAPRNRCLGIMLPYTPLHHLLMAELGFPVIATSGNRSEEPICTEEQSALIRLAGIADKFLIHNRPIARHVDDSVARVVLGRELLLRRARGYAPLPIWVEQELCPLLAVGAHQKSTVAVAVGKHIVVSQHIGDLDTAPARETFRQVCADLPRLYEMEPTAIVCDCHPDYHSTRFADESGLPVIRVQHHHAHVWAVMAEHGLQAPVLGVSWDGTGYGVDGTIWGGEFLRVARDGFERVACLRRFRLPGGAAAVREPRRTAIGLLYELMGDVLFDGGSLAANVRHAFTTSEWALLRRMLGSGFNSPWTSSAGRLFDAVAAIAGVRHVTRFEGQAAMELEFAIAENKETVVYPFDVSPDGIINWGPMVRAILDDLAGGIDVGTVAARFHDSLAELILGVAKLAGESKVVLGGGCFQNAYLLERTVERLRAGGFEVFWPCRVPPNDGGIAVGQLLAANKMNIPYRIARED
jgi:hydrogenase maturation protein HypF